MWSASPTPVFRAQGAPYERLANVGRTQVPKWIRLERGDLIVGTDRRREQTPLAKWIRKQMIFRTQVVD